MIPLIFIHEGDQKYLKYSILQAEKNNKKVFLLGDVSNKAYSSNWVSIEELHSEDFDEFSRVYVHMSTNAYQFELMCFKRYFILYEFVKRNKIEKFWLLDSDLMVYENLSALDMQSYDVAFSSCYEQDHYRWSASPHCSFWTQQALRSFLDFLFESYADIKKMEAKWNFHQSNHINGGICDMTLLYMWWKSNDSLRVYNTAIPTENYVFDHFISKSEGYKKNEYRVQRWLNKKKVVFRQGKAYFQCINGEWIRTCTIHAQGNSKLFIRDFYKERNCIFFYILTKIKHQLGWPIRQIQKRK